MGLLDGKTALIFGVANDHSIAWGIAQALHREGATVGFSYAGEVLERRVKPLAASIGATFVEPCDVSKDEEIAALMQKAGKAFGGIDVLVHCIAFANREELGGPFHETSREGFRLAMDISAYSLIAVAHAALPIMREQGGGDIVNISSIAGRFARAGSAVYNLTKFGVNAFTEGLRQEVTEDGIRVIVVEPGFVATELQSHNKGVVLETIEGMREQIGDVLAAEDIANGILYAVSQPPHVSINEVLIRPTRQTR
jgi:enoyl-[acyl-carrier protein] reductase I